MPSAVLLLAGLGFFQAASAGNATALEASKPCCQGACGVGLQKYWSIAKGFWGDEHCGECCMDPKRYDLFHFFEKNLTKANGTVSPCSDFGYTVYDSTPTHGFVPVSMTLDLYSKPKVQKAAEPKAVALAEPQALEAPKQCCQGSCAAGLQKYWSIAKGIWGDEHCGECCLDPKRYDLFHFFEANLTKANGTVTPCSDFGYTVYDSSPTHGFPPISITLDLYSKPKVQKAAEPKAVVLAEPQAPAAPELCCLGACAPGLQKYWSIAKGIWGDEHCGECCMDPKKYGLFHFFEKNLTLANGTVTPCSDFGYTIYDSTPTHGVPPVAITLDLYSKPRAKETIVMV